VNGRSSTAVPGFASSSSDARRSDKRVSECARQLSRTANDASGHVLCGFVSKYGTARCKALRSIGRCGSVIVVVRSLTERVLVCQLSSSPLLEGLLPLAVRLSSFLSSFRFSGLSSLLSSLSFFPAPGAAASRTLATVAASTSSFKLPDMPYDYGALEPYISGEIMKIHHTKHHQAYVTNLNAALEKYHKAESTGNVAEMIALQQAIRFNGGGHVNHSIFWQNLAPAGKGGGGEPEGDLAKLINAKWGNFDGLKKSMSAAAVAVQGSGWAWLGYNKTTQGLEVAACANQDPLSITGLVPLFGIDVWEHAYYLQYKNMRADYVGAIWSVANFSDISKRLADAKKLA
jgi:superoxide dismutase, Fe-Mn family